MLPKLSEFSIERSKLYQIFDSDRENVFIITGKTGSGKTNAVAQYCREREKEVLWYTFEQSDNDEESFLRHFIYGVSKFSEQVQENFETDGSYPLKLTKDTAKKLILYLLGIAENRGKKKEKIHIVFDNFEYIRNQNILNMVKMLLECLSGEMKVFILTSARLQSCFSKYMIEERYQNITEKNLCFSIDEIRNLAEKYFDKKQIKKEYLQKTEELTEGWAVSVKCLFQTMAEGEEPLWKVMEMTPYHLLMETMLYEYISYEIYEKFSQSEREFLVDTAAFHELNAELCDRCLNRKDSGKMMHIFMREQVVLASGKEQERYFKYFELFRIFLLEQGEKIRQKEKETLAAEFYLKKQRYDKALLYAEEEESLISCMFEQYGKKMMQDNRLELLKKCMDILRAAEHEFSIMELEVAAEYFYRIGDHEQMERYLNCADSMFGKENKYGVYRSLYRGLFHYEESPEKYEKQINNALFFLEENKMPLPYLLETEKKQLDKFMTERENELQEGAKKKIEVAAFGTFRVIVLEDGKELSWRTKKGCELFAYLLDRNGEAVDRKTLLSELWKEEIPNNAVAMLHNMFYNIRKELSYYNLEHLIQYKNKKYCMDISIIQSDLSEIQAASRYVEMMNLEKLKEYKHLFVKYKGRYLEDIDNEWARGRQEYYEKIYEKGCCLLAEECMEQEKYEEALIYLKNALSISVYSEKIVSRMLECYHKTGDLKSAKKQYEEFCVLLKKELDLEPGKEMQTTYKKCMTL